MAWEPGCLVECVADWHKDCDIGWPEKGVIYTIRECIDYGCGPGLRLVEIVNPRVNSRQGSLEPTFEIAGFRPITDDRLNIFRRLLAPLPSGTVSA